MIDPVDIRYEAAAIIPELERDQAILVMLTDKGRIAVHMRRTVLLGLYKQLEQALKQ